jgi:predicted ester cyclase
LSDLAQPHLRFVIQARKQIMSLNEKHKATVLAYVDALNCGDVAALAQLFTPDARIEGVTGSASIGEAMHVWRALHFGLNIHLQVDALTGEGDCVVVRYTETGRWTGPFFGMTEPTGNSFELTAMEWFEFQGERISRRWGVRDAASQARQAGFPNAVGPTRVTAQLKLV